MSNSYLKLGIPPALFALLEAAPAAAGVFFFNTGDPDGKIATASRPDTAFGFEIESADDFALPQATSITGTNFTGIVTGHSPVSSIGDVVVEIYRVFPNDSNLARTSGAPPFSTINVPARANSPSDVELDDRSSASGSLGFGRADLGSFSVLNSVQPGGIHKQPDQTTGGNAQLTGEEIEFQVAFNTPFVLPAGQYFFVPQVEVTNGDGAFFWLSAPKPIMTPATPFPSGFNDLQTWTRDGTIDPDWLRVGTDIVGGDPAPTFNASFELFGDTVPEPATWAMMLLGFAGLGCAGLVRTWRRRAEISLS